MAHYNPRLQKILGNAKDDDEYIDRVIVAATTPNGVFGAKVHWDHFQNLIAKIEHSLGSRRAAVPASTPGRLQVYFPDLRFIWLVRRNTVARAISHYRVKKTNRWQLDSRWVTDDTGGEGDPAFDFDEIDSFVRLGEAEDARWREFFKAHDISPLELSYEQLVQDLAGTVQGVLEFLGIPAANVELPPPTLRQQADQRSKDWEARYRRLCTDESA